MRHCDDLAVFSHRALASALGYDAAAPYPPLYAGPGKFPQAGHDPGRPGLHPLGAASLHSPVRAGFPAELPDRRTDSTVETVRNAFPDISVSPNLSAWPGIPRLAVDATAGNGHDTLFLAEQVGAGGRVWAFDVQEAALASARNRLEAEAPSLLDRVTFVHAGHEAAGEILPPEARGNLLAVTFNLGFLPGSDKQVVTTARNTLAALEILSGMLAPGGVMSVHSYQGHAGGAEEGAAVEAWFAALSWNAWRVARYSLCNKLRNPEVLYVAERMGTVAAR